MLGAAAKPFELRGEPPRGGPTSGGRQPFIGGGGALGAAGGIQFAAGGGAPGAAWTYLQLSPRVHRPFWKSRQTSFRPKFGGGGAYIPPFGGGGAYMAPFGGGIW